MLLSNQMEADLGVLLLLWIPLGFVHVSSQVLARYWCNNRYQKGVTNCFWVGLWQALEVQQITFFHFFSYKAFGP